MGSVFSSMRLLVVVGGGPKAGKSLFMRRLQDITARGLSSDTAEAANDDDHDGESIGSSSGNNSGIGGATTAAAAAATHKASAASGATLLRNVVKTTAAVLDYEAPVVAIRCVEVPCSFSGCHLLGGGGDSGAFTSFMMEGRQWGQVAAVVWVVDFAVLLKFDAAWAQSPHVANAAKENKNEAANVDDEQAVAVGLQALVRVLEAVDEMAPLEIVVRGGFPNLSDSDEALNLALRAFASVLPRRKRRSNRRASTRLGQRQEQGGGEQQQDEEDGVEQSSSRMIDTSSSSKRSDVHTEYVNEHRSDGYICSDYDEDDDDDEEEEGGGGIVVEQVQGVSHLRESRHHALRRQRNQNKTKQRHWSIVHTPNWGSGSSRGGLPPALLWLQRALLQSSP